MPLSMKFNTVPAYPGFFVCTPIWDEGVCNELHEVPVVAWNIFYDNSENAIDGKVICTPVIPEDTLGDLYALKLPDGKYDFAYAEYGLTEKECIEVFNKEEGAGKK